jgi:hypothetical protein
MRDPEMAKIRGELNESMEKLRMLAGSAPPKKPWWKLW